MPQRHAELGGGIRRDFVARRGTEHVADEETHVVIFSKRPVFPRAPSGAQEPFKFFGLCRNRAHRGRAGAVVVGVGGWWWWFGVGHARGPDPSTLEKCARRRRHGGGGNLLGFSSSGPREPDIFKGNCNIQHLELGNLRHFFFFAFRVFFPGPRESIFPLENRRSGAKIAGKGQVY